MVLSGLVTHPSEVKPGDQRKQNYVTHEGKILCPKKVNPFDPRFFLATQEGKTMVLLRNATYLIR